MELVLPAHAELKNNSSTVTISPVGSVSAKSIIKGTNKQQVHSDTSLIKLLEITRMADMMQSVSGTQSDMMAFIIESTLKQEDLEQMTAKQRQEMMRVLTQYSQQMLAETNKATVEMAQKHFITVAKNHYTQAEVDAQIAFYNTEVGQSILDKQPKLMQEYMKVLTPEVIEIANATREKLTPQLEKDLEAIFR
ncbi:DUF2059 domain-containing protein [Psychrobacter piechaudii]|uniref:DUF2059 domain-containing protein n=1 Tax=Psychrobacter piechaudii TaxID=1945521 RepID=A0A1R4GUZ8_9GAMM|nr:DUF2059 domain-containing protein [Psychrobacter piechaudii]SJM71893.1 hypothetical protein A1232T_01417 [Psychrobacter piechaudii]